MEGKRFRTVNTTADDLNLPPHFLRQGCKDGWIPHLMVGNRFMIDYFRLCAILDTMTEHEPSNRKDD